MRFLVLFLFLSFYEACFAGSLNCSQVFANSSLQVSGQDHGVINFLQISKEAIREQENHSAPTLRPEPQGLLAEAPYEVQSYFSGQLHRGLNDFSLWKADLLAQKDEATGALRLLTQTGKSYYRKTKLPQPHLIFFRAINELSLTELSQLNSSQQVEIFKLFARWNLLPSAKLQERLFSATIQNFETWKNNDFFNFAFARKLSPLKLSPDFSTKYKELILERFSKLPPRIQIEVLTAELFQSTWFSTQEMNGLLLQTLRAVDSLSLKTEFIGPLKDLYRGLLHLRGMEPSHFYTLTGRLEQAIETQLNSHGLSLRDGGTSGFNNSDRGIEPRRLQLEKNIEELFDSSSKEYEKTQAFTPGFFDPVDVYFPKLQLVLEWDGPHHYFRSFNNKGEFLTDLANIVLRPIDQIKDNASRKRGLRVIRYSKQNDPLKDNFDLLEDIKRQNSHY